MRSQNPQSTVVIGTDLPYFPGKNGNDFFNVRYLALKERVSVVGQAYTFVPKAGLTNLERAVQHCYFWPNPSPLQPVTNEPKNTAELRGIFCRLPRRLLAQTWPLMLGLRKRPDDAFHHLMVLSKLASQLLYALNKSQPSVCVLLQSGTEPWLDYLPRFVASLVYFHDLRTDIERKRIHFLGSAASGRGVLAKLIWQEKKILRGADCTAFVSERDLSIARRMESVSAALALAPIPIDQEYFRHSKRTAAKQIPNVLFTGHLGHQPNVDALLYFVGEIWPLIQREVPEARFVIAGAFPAPEVEKVVRSANGVSLHADVPDIRPFFEQGAVYVVPMRYGGGVRQKILEAWSMGVPVVSTTMAIEGINAEDGIQLWIRDEPAEFAAAVSRLLTGNEETSSQISSGQRYVEEHHTIEVAAGQFHRAVQKTRAVRRTRPFRVLFDLRWMGIGRAGGIEQLVYELASSISKLDATNEYRFLGPRSTLLDWQFPDSFKRKLIYSDSFELQIRDRKSEFIDALMEGSGMPRMLNREMRFLRFLNQLDFDLVHSFQGFNYPEFSQFPSVVTMPDLQHLSYPQFFSKEAYEMREQLFRTSVENANHVICISRFTLEEVHKFYGVPREKMSVVWITPSRACRIPLQLAERTNILAGLGIRWPFLFFPAHNWPHKNHQRLLIAFAESRGKLPPQTKLVFTGGNLKEGVDLAGVISRLNLESSVVHLGYVTPIQLRALYSAAKALVFPSLFEGFGMPIAEAILCGCPVTCSQTTSLPEIAGDAALLFDPENTEEIGLALIKICTDDILRDRLRKNGLRRRSAFSSWTPALETISIYHRVIQERFS
jgi:glycosyltransferase involved in cell wall biosynthesis